MRIIIMASGNGSNFSAIYQAIKNKEIPAEFVTLIVDKKEAYAIERAKQLGAKYEIVNFSEFANKADYEKSLLAVLKKNKPDLICLAGYMKIIGPTILNEYEGKIINIHPSLLPKYPGKSALDDALMAGEKTIGVTVHFVDHGVDTGKIINQTAFSINGLAKVEIEQKLHNIEHELYIKTIKTLSGGEQ